jgi:hypothetical protein
MDKETYIMLTRNNEIRFIRRWDYTYFHDMYFNIWDDSVCDMRRAKVFLHTDAHRIVTFLEKDHSMNIRCFVVEGHGISYANSEETISESENVEPPEQPFRFIDV